jgi:hypothetical protein
MNYKRGVYAKGYEYTFFNSIESFMRNYIKGIPPETPGQQGLYNMEVEKAIFRSCTQKVKVVLN